MKLHQLNAPTRKSIRRVGRGLGSGVGKTAGRGTKGQRSRAGSAAGAIFEGGQNSLIHRLPKLRGFKSSRPAMQLIHTDQLNVFKAGQTVSAKELKAAGLIDNVRSEVKLVKRDELKKSLTVEVSNASAAAIKAITQAGGKFTKNQVVGKSAKPSSQKN